jgi:hypothetical protein
VPGEAPNRTALAAGVASGHSTIDNRGLSQGSEPVTLNPADFTTTIDNPSCR